MSIEKCNRCEEFRDTDFVSDCEKCLDKAHDDLWSLLCAGMYADADEFILNNSDIDLSDTYEQDEIFLNWLKEQDHEQSLHDEYDAQKDLGI